MGLFNRNQSNEPISQRQNMTRKHAVCRSNLLLLIIFTVINMVLVMLKSESYFVFSASVPYFITALGSGFGGEAFLSAPIFYVFLAISVAILAVYLLCWILSKKHIAWLIVALVMFVVDTLFMLVVYFLFGGLADAALDIIFHGWVLYYLISGVVAYFKLKKIPEYEDVNSSGAANAFLDNVNSTENGNDIEVQ